MEESKIRAAKKECRLILPGREYSFSFTFLRNGLILLLSFIILSCAGFGYWAVQTYRFQEEIHDYQAFLQQRQATKLPVLWPTEQGVISSGYGPRKLVGSDQMENHQGLDIAAPFGTKVYASAAGLVKSAGWKGGYGRYVQIDHENNYVSGYGHMSKLAVQTGDLVEQGDIIGYVGSSGYSTGPHLHFEIFCEGKAINPLDMLRKDKLHK